MNVAFGIVASKKREERARALMAYLHAKVMWLDDREWVSLNTAMERCTEGHLRVMDELRARTSTGWCVILEDDAKPVEGFTEALTRALDTAPARIIGLYLGTGNPSGPIQRAINEIIDKPAAWIMADCLLQGVGYAIHRSLLADLIIDIGNQTVGELPLRITRYAQLTGQPIAYTHPSLIDHRDEESMIYPGIDQRSRLPRRAHRFGTRVSYPAQSTVQLPFCPGWSVDPLPDHR